MEILLAVHKVIVCGVSMKLGKAEVMDWWVFPVVC